MNRLPVGGRAESSGLCSSFVSNCGPEESERLVVCMRKYDESQPPGVRVRTLADSQGKFGNRKIKKKKKKFETLTLTTPWVFTNLIKQIEFKRKHTLSPECVALQESLSRQTHTKFNNFLSCWKNDPRGENATPLRGSWLLVPSRSCKILIKTTFSRFSPTLPPYRGAVYSFSRVIRNSFWNFVGEMSSFLKVFL